MNRQGWREGRGLPLLLLLSTLADWGKQTGICDGTGGLDQLTLD